MSYPWIKDSQYLTPSVPDYLAVTSPNGLYLTNGVAPATIITPTSVTSTTFNGALNGSATSAATVTIAEDDTNTTFYPVFVSNNTGTLALKVDKTPTPLNLPLSYNPSTGILNATSFSPGSGFSTYSALTSAGLEVLNATSGRTKILNSQITCATTATNPPTTTITPLFVTCSSANAASTTKIEPTAVTVGSGTTTFSQLQNTGLQVVNAGSNTTTINSSQITCAQVSGGFQTTITPNSVTSTTFSGALSGNATSATNIAGGVAGQIHYQSGAGTTAFVAVGNGGQFLQANGPAAPTWVNQNTAATVSMSPNAFPNSGTTTLTANFNNSFSSVTRHAVLFANNNGTITISVNTYALSGGVSGGQYTIVLVITMNGNAGTTLNFNGTGTATGAKFNFVQITNTYGGTAATKYVVLTFAYDGTNYFMSGSNFV